MSLNVANPNEAFKLKSDPSYNMEWSTETMPRPDSLELYDTDEIYSFNYPFDYTELNRLHKLAIEFKSAPRISSSGTITDWWDNSLWGFDEARAATAAGDIDFTYVLELAKEFEMPETDSFAFYSQAPWSKHNWHTDSLCECSMNVLLEGSEDGSWDLDQYGPVQYKRETIDGVRQFVTYNSKPKPDDDWDNFYYRNSIINTRHTHRAYAEGDPRRMFRFSIRDDFDRTILRFKKMWENNEKIETP